MVVAQIDGLSATGKSTLWTELSRRGCCAVDSDAEFAYYGDPVSGHPTDVKTRSNWIWDVGRLRAFCRRLADVPIFICGGAMNQDQCADLFTHRFLLRIDDETMRRRLLTRRTNDYGKDPAELAEQLELNRRARRSANVGWTVVDAARPIAEVADAVIELTLCARHVAGSPDSAASAAEQNGADDADAGQDGRQRGPADSVE